MTKLKPSKLGFGQINRRNALRLALNATIGGLGALMGGGLTHMSSAAERSAIEYSLLRESWQAWREEERGHQTTQTVADSNITAASDPVVAQTQPTTRTSPAPSRIATQSKSAQTPAAKNGPVGTGTGYAVPTRLIIPDIRLDVPIQTVGIIYSRGGAEWASPARRAAGWHNTSAKLGEPGNLVLNGHNNILGRVFAGLYNLTPGSLVTVKSNNLSVVYRLSHYLLLREAGQPISVLMENAKHILPTDDTRLTMVTCWPITNNTHRWIWVGYPTA